ncbi:MAG: hypothetical protein P8010_02620 [Desulfosarcinaceae bacterium]|jgi:hypothetical protein
MRASIDKNEDCCPQCGHLLPIRSWNCVHCDWSWDPVKMQDIEMRSWDSYTNLDNIADLDRDADLWIDTI